MPRAQPPHRQLAQPEQGLGTGERYAVVGANGFRKPELAEHPLEDGEGVGLLRGMERLAAEQIAAGEVGDGQRVTVATIGQHELAFVIGAPEVIGPSRLRQRGALRLVATFTAVLDQAMPIEHCMHGADRRRLDVVVAAAQLRADLGRTPARMLALELHDQRFDLHRQLVRLSEWPSAAVSEPFAPQIPVPLEDLVASLARDIELTA